VAQFNGQSTTRIIAPDTPYNSTFSRNNAITISAWIYELSNNECEVSVANIYNLTSFYPTFLFRFGVSGGGWSPNRIMLELFTSNTQTNMFSTSVVPYNQWSNIVGEYNGTYVNFYLNGISAGSSQYAAILSTAPKSMFVLGANPNSGCSSGFLGSISNIQIYNTSLSSNEIQALYQEGIGGAPIDLQHLVAWWPLNGDANDYSGNGNNGVPTNVKFVSNWWQGYTPP
jgi:hypothetical protein